MEKVCTRHGSLTAPCLLVPCLWLQLVIPQRAVGEGWEKRCRDGAGGLGRLLGRTCSSPPSKALRCTGIGLSEESGVCGEHLCFRG